MFSVHHVCMLVSGNVQCASCVHVSEWKCSVCVMCWNNITKVLISHVNKHTKVYVSEWNVQCAWCAEITSQKFMLVSGNVQCAWCAEITSQNFLFHMLTSTHYQLLTCMGLFLMQRNWVVEKYRNRIGLLSLSIGITSYHLRHQYRSYITSVLLKHSWKCNWSVYHIQSLLTTTIIIIIFSKQEHIIIAVSLRNSC